MGIPDTVLQTTIFPGADLRDDPANALPSHVDDGGEPTTPDPSLARRGTPLQMMPLLVATSADRMVSKRCSSPGASVRSSRERDLATRPWYGFGSARPP